jgi:CubicO group peptidase (beta-lactamase class C family)
MPRLDRRHFLVGSAAFAGMPARSQPTTWRAIQDAGQELEQLHALLIHQHGVEVFGKVFRGPEMDAPAPIKSVSKTLVAALTGAAIDRGEISSIDATIGELAPGLIPDGADPRVQDITIENLVTMQAGLERTSGPNYGGWVSSRNWVANALSRPFETEPGERMLYSTGSFHVLGAVLSVVTGQPLLEQARHRLGAPLGISIPPWTRDPQGRYLGGNEMSLSLPAMIHFGEMYRLNGMWNDTQVLSESWVSRSFEPVTRSPWSGLRYGYGWFLGQSEGDDYALARGYGGQVICVVPGLGLTLAITSDSTQPARSIGYFGDLMQFIEATILPLARKDAT